MADQKLTALPQTTSASADDLLYIVDDPSVASTSNSISFEDLQASLTGVGSVSVTQPAGSSVLTIADGATLAVPSNASVSGTNTGDQTNISGNAATATNLQGGLGGEIPYQTGENLTAFLANGSAGQVLQSNGTTLAPSWATIAGGTVTDVSVVTANGVSGSVANSTTTPAITLVLGAITPTSVNGNTITTGTGTLTLGAGSTLATSATNSVTLTSTAATNVTLPTTGTLATLAGSENLTNKTVTSPTLVTPSAFTTGGTITLAENTSIALDPSLSDGSYSGTTIAGTAGATLAFGDLIYLAAADSRWELVDATTSSTSGAVLTGMCVLAAAADGDPTVILLRGNIRADSNFPALTVGAPVYASTTAGDIQVAQPSSTDEVIQVVGFALTADSIIFNPSPDYITSV